MKRAKMNKKGFEISSILGWIIGVLAVVIILFIVLGPEQLLSKAREAAFSFGIELPGEKPPEIPGGEDKIPEELTLYFDYLTAMIDEEIKKTNERCLIPLNTIPEPKENYFIAFFPGYVSIKKKIKESSYAATDKSKNIPGFNSCIVAYNGAENFFNNWLGSSVEKANPSKPEYFNDDKANSLIVIESKTKLITPNDNGDYDLKDGDPNYYSILYKADANHICFIPSWDDFLNSDCSEPTGGDIQKGLDNDCFWNDEDTRLRSIIPACSEDLDTVYLCDDENCLNDPPTPAWRRTTTDVWSIEDVIPSNEDSEPDGDTIKEQIGSIRIKGPYDVRLYENKNYEGKKICFRDEGGYRLDDYSITCGFWGCNGWNEDTYSVKIIADGACINPGVTEE